MVRSMEIIYSNEIHNVNLIAIWRVIEPDEPNNTRSYLISNVSNRTIPKTQCDRKRGKNSRRFG